MKEPNVVHGVARLVLAAEKILNSRVVEVNAEHETLEISTQDLDELHNAIEDMLDGTYEDH